MAAVSVQRSFQEAAVAASASQAAAPASAPPTNPVVVLSAQVQQIYQEVANELISKDEKNNSVYFDIVNVYKSEQVRAAGSLSPVSSPNDLAGLYSFVLNAYMPKRKHLLVHLSSDEDFIRSIVLKALKMQLAGKLPIIKQQLASIAQNVKTPD